VYLKQYYKDIVLSTFKNVALTGIKVTILYKKLRLTEAENFAASIWGIKDGLKEMMGPRAKISLVLKFFNCWKILYV